MGRKGAAPSLTSSRATGWAADSTLQELEELPIGCLALPQ